MSNKTIGEIDLIDLLPEALRLEDVKPIFFAIQEELKRVQLGIENIYISGSLNDVASNIIDALAKDRNTIGYDQSLSVDQRRSLVDNSYQRSRQAGTPGAVKLAVESLGFDTEIINWFENTNPLEQVPFTFIVNISNNGSGFSEQDQLDVTRAVIANKNLRSHILRIVFFTTIDFNVYNGSYVKVGTDIKIPPLFNFEQQIASEYSFGSYVKTGSEIRIPPGVGIPEDAILTDSGEPILTDLGDIILID